MKLIVSWALALAALFGGATGACAADYPSKPVRIILPYAAGGGGDILTRVIAEKLSTLWNQPVIVDNRPGAGATIGTEVVARAAPDGYTLLMTAGTIAVSPSAYAKLPYDVIRDFSPITTVARSPYVLVVHPSVRANSVEEFLALARAASHKLNVGSAGNGTLAHLCVELLKTTTGIDVVHVPYKGSSLALNDLVGGQVAAVFDTPAAVRSFVARQRIRALAVTTTTRSKSLPAVPTMAEAGVQDYDVSVWFGLLAPAGTPKDVIRHVHAGVAGILASPQAVERIEAQGFEIFTTSPEELGSLIRQEVSKWSALVKKSGIRFD